MKTGITPGGNEHMLGSWSVTYHSPVGDTFKGRLIITERRMMLDREQPETSPCRERLMSGVLDARRHLSIPREAIASIDSTGALKKRLTVRLNDGQKHVFETGVFAEPKIVDALEK